MKTAFLMTLLTLLLVMVGDFAGGQQGMMIMLIFSLAMNFYTYWNSDKIVLSQYRAHQVDENSAPALYGIVKRLAQRANLPMPKVYIIDDQVPNAFATGRNPQHAAVAVTTALMNYLTPKEIEGVLGHELTHVKNGDILISTVAASLAGVITTISRFALWFGGGRDRENSNPIAGLFFLILAPIAAALISLILLKKFKMTKDDHALIRAAVAAKHKYGAVNLTQEQKKRCELISGQKLENTWLGKDNDSPDAYTLETNENGEYLILIEKELEKKALEEN